MIDYPMPAWIEEYMAAMEEALGEAYTSRPATCAATSPTCGRRRRPSAVPVVAAVPVSGGRRRGACSRGLRDCGRAARLQVAMVHAREARRQERATRPTRTPADLHAGARCDPARQEGGRHGEAQPALAVDDLDRIDADARDDADDLHWHACR